MTPGATPAISVRPVLLLAGAVGVLSQLPLLSWGAVWFSLKPNRLVAGEAFGLHAAVGAPALALLAVWALLLLASLHPRAERITPLLVAAATLLTLYLGGRGAALLTEGQPASARVSLGAGFWLAAVACYVAWFAARGAAPGTKARARRTLIPLAITLAGAIYLVSAGGFGDLGLARELAAQGADFRAELARHLSLSLTSLLFGAAIGVPAAILAHRRPAAARWLLPSAAFFQTIPSLALFGVLLPLLAAVGQGVTLRDALFAGVLLLPLPLLRRAKRPWVRAALLAVAALPALLYFTLLTTLTQGLLAGLFGGGSAAPTAAWEGFGTPLKALGVRGIGAAPALIALTLYSLLPMMRNTFEGLQGVPDAALEAGRGMGMSERQLLRRVKLPLALPLMIDGVRAAAVLTIGITTVAFLIGAGGLGVFIQRGIDQVVPDLVLLGALPVIALALAADGALRGAGALITAPPLRRGGNRGA